MAGDASLFLGAPGGVGDVRLAGDLGLLPGGQPMALTGIQLLPLTFSLHSPLDGWDGDKPQVQPLPGGASAVRIPGHGCLYTYRRALFSGAEFGLFQVTPAGGVRVLLTLPGTGGGGGQPALVSRIAVDPANQTILLATQVAAGGDLLELDLSSGVVIDRTAGLPPLQLASPGALALTNNRGFAATGTELLSFLRQPGAQATAQPLPTPLGAAAHVPGDFARSEDGSSLALVAGATPAEEFVFVVQGAGTPERISDTPVTISPGGYLPEVEHGPFLALSTDSSHVAWRTEGVASREGWLATTGLPRLGAELTGDATFLDTLDEVAPFAFFTPNRLLVGVGELADPLLGGIDSMDMFSVNLDSIGQPVYEALTATTGLQSPPFMAKPKGSPEVLRRLPGTNRLLVQDEKLERLTLVGAGSAPVLIEGLARKLRFEHASGDRALLAIERSDPFDDLRFVVLDIVSGTWTDLAVLPDEVSVVTAASRGDGTLGLVVELGLASWTLGLDLQGPSIELTLPTPFPGGPTLDFDAAGNLLLSSNPLQAPALFGLDPLPGPPQLQPIAPQQGFWLPR